MKALNFTNKFIIKYFKKGFSFNFGLRRFSTKNNDLEKLIEEQNNLLKEKSISKDNSQLNQDSNNSDEESTNLNFSSISSDYMDTKIDINFEDLKMKCNGCGTYLQTKKEKTVGYIPEKKLNDYFNQTNIRKEEKEDIEEGIQENLDDIQIIYEGEEEMIQKKQRNSLFKEYELIKKEMKKEKIYCERCYKLSNYKNFNGKEVSKEKVDKYTLLVKNIDPNKLIDKIFSKIPVNTNVFYIFDIFDMESTIRKELLLNLESKGSKVVFVGNKFDVLPKNTSDDRIRIWVGQRLREICKDVLKDYTYIIVSSRTGHNFDHVIHKIKKIKELFNNIKFPKIFILGYTNVGKSTFINKLIDHSNKFKLRELKKHQKEYENADIQFSSAELTSSPLPGTTLGITKVSDINLAVKIFDTPGIPNKESLSYYMDDMLDIISVNMNKKILTHSINVKQGYTIWLGAVARVDFLNGDDKYFSFFFSQHVTVHKTEIIYAEEVLERQYGKLLRPLLKPEFKDVKMKKHEFNLKCDKFSILNYDISISGLGWFSISGKGFCQILVSVPENVNVSMRNKPLMPYEIKFKGVKKYYGNTINKDSKINRKFSRDSNKTNKKKNFKAEFLEENVDSKDVNKNI